MGARRKVVLSSGVALLTLGSALAWQVPWCEYPGQDNIAIYDGHGRLIVAICHNMDLGDAWEWADWPQYDEKFSALALRIVSNYVVYSMTH